MAAFLFLCLTLGGGPGGLQDYILQVAALGLIALSRWRNRLHTTIWDVPALALIVGITLLAVVQLTPVPPAVWHALAGRAEVVNQMTIAGVATDGWRAISLDPLATERSLLWVLPGIAMYLSACVMSANERTRLVLLVLVVALLSLLLSVVQVAGGPEGMLHFYRYGENVAAFGFFSNHNHLACMLAMTIPLAVGLLVAAQRRRAAGDHVPVSWLLLLAITIGSLLLALPVNGSRAAIVLGGLAMAGSLAMLFRAHLARRTVLALFGAGLLAIVLTVQFGMDRVLTKLQDSGDDQRSAVRATTAVAAHHFGMLGSGLGTFVLAYQAVAPERDIGPQHINFAHSDYHQLWLETGIPGLVLVVWFIVWFLWRGSAIWIMRPTTDPVLILGWAATVSILVVLVHSGFDYPLRKTAIIALTGLCCALLSSARTPTSERLPEVQGDDLADDEHAQQSDHRSRRSRS